MKMAAEIVKHNVHSDLSGDPIDKVGLRSAHSVAINHVKCEAAVNDTDIAKSLLVEYRKLCPTCIELVLMSARLQKDHVGYETGVPSFEAALLCWPKDEPGVQCIWNQYIEFTLENKRIDLAEKLMVRWFESVWKVQDLESRKFDVDDAYHNHKDECFGFLNLSLHRLLQNDKEGARLSIDKALKVANSEDLNHAVREHVIFLLSDGSGLGPVTAALKIPRFILSYLADVRFFPVSEPLSRRSFRSIKKPKTCQMVDKLVGPVSLDCSLINLVPKEIYGPSLLPKNVGKLTEFVDFVEALMEILPANYQLAMSACKLVVQTLNLSKTISDAVKFWASSLVVNSILQAFPVAPEYVWVEAVDIFINLELFDICEMFHQLSVQVYPFSVKLWSSYYSLSKKFGNMSAVKDAASETGIKLV